MLFAPALLFALRRRPLGIRIAGLFLAFWLASLSLLWYSEATRDAIAGFLLREDTAYAPGFSEAAFRTITPGQSEDDVQRVLGRPFREFWFYTPPDPRPPDERPAPPQQGCLGVRFEGGVVVSMHDAGACTARGVGIGRSPVDVRARLGAPLESCWHGHLEPGGVTSPSAARVFLEQQGDDGGPEVELENNLYKRDLTVLPIAA